VLAHHAHLLPSFASLPLAQQLSVRFTQAKMQFNHGWLVQAEAPPKALFGPFKAVITAGGAAPADVAFYFVHWLTDLAGAEPSPLEGSEKFVLKFPHQVLGSFIRSFGVINELAVHSETAVFESYLINCWQSIRPHITLAGDLPTGLGGGGVPVGDAAIALMRLAVQAQVADKQQALVDAFGRLSREDKQTLADEMSRTGDAEQSYDRSTPSAPGGPALLIYYSPAFIRTLCPESAPEALHMLAEVYRRSRLLWPLSEAAASQTVTVRIDQIKELSAESIRAVYATGESWLLTKRNDLEAVVEKHPLDSASDLLKAGVCVEVLRFWSGSTSSTPAIGGSECSLDGSLPSVSSSQLMSQLAPLTRNASGGLSTNADAEVLQQHFRRRAMFNGGGRSPIQ